MKKKSQRNIFKLRKLEAKVRAFNKFEFAVITTQHFFGTSVNVDSLWQFSGKCYQ